MNTQLVATLSPLPTPDTLVVRWFELLQAQGGSALSEAVLRHELDRLAERLVAALPAPGQPLTTAYRTQLANVGEQLVELGIGGAEALADAQSILVGWLTPQMPTAIPALQAFLQGALSAWQGRREQGDAQERQALTDRLAWRARLDSLGQRLSREWGQPNQDRPTLLALTLSSLLRELDGTGAGFFEWQPGGWRLLQAQGTLPAVSFIQPPHGEPPRLTDSMPQWRALGSEHHIAVPVPHAGEVGALLLLAGEQGSLPHPAVLVDGLASLGEGLGLALHGAELAGQLQQLGHTQETVPPPTTAMPRSAQHSLGWQMDEGDVVRRLAVPPDMHLTVEPRRLVLPLNVRGEALGKLLLEDDEPHEWAEDDLELLNIIADQMAQALDAARLYQESQRRAAQIEAAAEVGRAASRLLALEELTTTAVNQIRRTFGYYHAQVFLLDEEESWAVLRASTGEVGSKLLAANHRLAVGSRSVIGQVTATGQPVVARDTDVGDVPWRFNELLPETRAELAVPLRVGTHVIGALDVQSLSPDVFYGEDIAVLQILADQLAVAIQNARAFAQLRESAEQLRELDKLKSQFLASMSHELRTPLNSIIGFSRVILKGIDGPVTDLQKKDLTTIYNSGQILLQLIDSILDISKIEAGKMELDFEEVELRQVIDVALSTAAGLIKDKPVQLLREVPPDLPVVQADPVRLRQVLLNLLSNAAKFTDEGFIRLTATHMGDEVMISVTDTGLGIPAEKHEKLFEAFYQVDGSATRKVGGTGLGLAITRSFVAMHGGQLWVESSGVPGEGTTFTFTLPVNGPGAAQGEDALPAPLVLAIDDEPGITMLYDKYLAPEGYRFAACHDPRRAVEEAATLQPQLILLDIRMPNLNGFEVLAALRGNLLTRDIPIIMCSIEAITRVEEQALQSGAAACLQKPVLRQDLVSAVGRWTGAPAGLRSRA